MDKYSVGTCSFTDKALDGAFYPKGIRPAERITFYAEHFNVVEVDSSYYALPSERNSYLFAQRTPADFVFHFKAFGLMTQHRVSVKQLGRSLGAHLPPDFDEPYVQTPPPEMLRQAFDMFYGALMPLKLAGKLGLILFQYPPYFTKNSEHLDYILQCKEWMKDYRLAIEFRHNSWTNEQELASTLEFLRDNDLSYVSVDEPQFTSGVTVPPVAAATNDTAYIRFHGRNTKNWFRRKITVAERFDYLYNHEELAEWTEKIKDLADEVDQVHVMFNNNMNTYPIENARDMAAMLGALETKRKVELIDQPGLGI